MVSTMAWSHRSTHHVRNQWWKTLKLKLHQYPTGLNFHFYQVTSCYLYQTKHGYLYFKEALIKAPNMNNYCNCHVLHFVLMIEIRIIPCALSTYYNYIGHSIIFFMIFLYSVAPFCIPYFITFVICLHITRILPSFNIQKSKYHPILTFY